MVNFPAPLILPLKSFLHRRYTHPTPYSRRPRVVEVSMSTLTFHLSRGFFTYNPT